MLSPVDADYTSSDNINFSTWAEIEIGYSFNIDEDLDLLYKAEVGDEDDPATTEEGPFAPSYETTFGDEPLDPEEALIEWIFGQSAIDCKGDNSCFLIVKDGNHQPAQYLFDISDWDGMMDIELTEFWPDKGAISNVAIWGRQTVSEPSIIALFGLGLFGLGFARRRSHN